VRLPWRLTARQHAIATAPDRYLVLVAGRRFGKTVLAITWLVAEVMGRPAGALGYYVAPYRVMAKAIAWDMLLRATAELRVAKNESELTVTLLGGRRAAHPGPHDPETLEGVGLVAVVLDEFGRMKLDAWQKSVRPALSDHGGRALFCGKPRGFNHLKDFYDRGQRPDANPGWRSWLFRTIDGGHVPAADVDEARASLPAKVYRQEYEATFESLAGRVYEDFTRRTHVVAHAELERLYKRDGRWAFRRTLVALDWGFNDPGVALVIGQTGAGDLVVIHEEHRRGVQVNDAGWLGIFKALRTDFAPERFVADPSEPGFIAATRAALGGRPVVENAQNDIREGVRRVATKLLAQPHSRRPGLVVSDACVETIREFEGYVYREVRGASTEDPVDVDNHCMDALRYGVMALTRAVA